MKNIFLTCLILSLTFYSCTNDDNNQNSEILSSIENNSIIEEEDISENQIKIEEMNEEIIEYITKNNEFTNVLGAWTGKFNNKLLNISITSIAGNIAQGYSIIDGDFSTLKGWLKTEDNINYAFGMSQENNKDNGYFEFNINLENIELSGSWEPFTGGESAKVFSLNKSRFKYQANAGLYSEASKEKYNNEMISKFDSDQLKYIKNEIYAKHGYSFKDDSLSLVFSKFDWYYPVNLDVRHLLTDIELSNLEAIRQ